MSDTATATTPEVDANHPNGTDPNGDVAEPTSQPTTDTAPTAAKPRKQTKYELAGVGDWTQADGSPYLNPANGRFLVGHDAKLKSRLVAEQVAFEAEQAAKPEGERADVTETPQYQLLAKLDWLASLTQSREARKNRDAKKAQRAQAAAARKQTKDGNPEPTVDRLEEGKKNKTQAQETVDKIVHLDGEGKRARYGRVLRVRRSVEEDIVAPWVAVVAVPKDQRNPDGEFDEVEIPVTELNFA